MKKIISLLIILAIIVILPTGTKTAQAYQGDTKIIVMVEDNATEVKANETFKVYIKALNATDLFGLQLSLKYDPDIIQIVDNGINIEENMSIPGGQTEDLENGILTYPFINTQPTKEKIEEMPIADIEFKALKQGQVLIKLSDVKAVNRDSKIINYNTQYQTLLNVIDTSEAPSLDLPKDPREDQDADEKDKGQGDKSSQGSKSSSGQEEPNQAEGTGDKEDPSPDKAGDKSDDSNGSQDSETATDQPDGKEDTTDANEGEQSTGDVPAEKGGPGSGQAGPWIYGIIGLVAVLLAVLGIYISRNKGRIKNIVGRIINK